MTLPQRTAVALFVSAVVLGVVGDIVFESYPLGLNALLFAGAFTVALTVLIQIGKLPFHQGRRLMVGPLLVFAALLAWHDSPLLVATNLFAIAAAVTLGALPRTRRRVQDAEVGDYVVGAASAGTSAVVGAVTFLQMDMPWDRLSKRARGPQMASVARGFAIGLPLLVLFGALFVAADAVFENLIVSAVPNTGELGLHLVVAAGLAWVSAGLLRDLLAVREDERLIAPAVKAMTPPRISIGPAEVAIALAIVNVVFVAFVLVQIRYLFGGQGLVESRLHLTYAEYARHGFFELVAVATLVLVLLMAVDYATRDKQRWMLAVRILSWTLIALVLVVMASALERMRLYQRVYGLTELRIFATGFILWLGCVFVWLAATVLRHKRRAFASGAVLLGFIATIALNATNPDALIARTNLDRPKADVAYVATLSDDSVPGILAKLPTLPAAQRSQLATALLLRETDSSGGILGWNQSRSHAQALLRAHHDELVAYASP